MVRNTLSRVLGGCLAAVVAVGLLSAPPAQATTTPQLTLTATGHKAHQKKQSRKQRNKSIAKSLVKKRGWSDRQYKCLVKLWTRESNWNHRARNGSSGAYGIPQALPATKMRSAGKDWRTNPKTQIKWGLRYIKGRYDTPCGAWKHFGNRGWY